MKKILIAAALIAFSSGSAFAAGVAGNTATVTGANGGVATAIVVAPITLTHTAGASMNFGKFTVGTGTGSIIMSSSGTVSAGTGTATPVSGVTPSLDNFTVTGDPSRYFNISTTGGTVGTMVLTTTPSVPTAQLSATGTATFSVYGTLATAGTETAGSYTGSYGATVTYQ